MILQTIKSPADIKHLNKKELSSLSKEIRNKIIETTGNNGGHLASNLGVVELTLALHRVFNSPQDAIVWDVSHQCYVHKLLTGRYENFSSLRKKGGISGFTRITESPHDYFDAGHASSSISSALGLLAAWDTLGRKDKVVAVIGDGALTGGMAYEALEHAGHLSKNLIVIVNDNQMSIGKNVGSISRYLSRLTTTSSYQNFRHKVDRAIDMIPYFNRKIGKFVYRFKRGLKGLFLTNNLFVDLGFEYVGPLNGHDIEQMENVFKRVKKVNRPVVIHVVTKKGKGYSPAEDNPESFHGVGPFAITDGKVEKFDNLSFTQAFSEKMMDLGKTNPKVCAITAAMTKGTGLDSFSRHFKNRFYDVGICEEHAVTFAGGLACGGMIPVVAIYSTFIQRSVDQIIEDVALQNRHVVICLDRSGAVPNDGETHQGIFDISLLRCIPNLKFLTVASQNDLNVCLDWAVNKNTSPVVIRWPKTACASELPSFNNDIEEGKGIFCSFDEYAPSISKDLSDEKVSKMKKILLVCTGSMFSTCLKSARDLLLHDIISDIYSLRFIKPFDEQFFIDLCSIYDGVVFVEDGINMGSFSEYLESLVKKGYNNSTKTTVLTFPDRFVNNGSRQEILEEVGLDSENIIRCARELVK